MSSTTALSAAAAAAAAAAKSRSTKGASKQRRDLINTEIEKLKKFLPVPESARQRLFQLQVMSLACVFIRRDRYLPIVLGDKGSIGAGRCHSNRINICEAIKGFLMLITRQGKFLYLSENVSDYLGHSAEEILSQGDSIWELIDSCDHFTVHSVLMSGPGFAFDQPKIFLCRLNTNRASLKRAANFQKVLLIDGRYLPPCESFVSYGSLQPVFAALCSPLLTADCPDMESILNGNPSIFSALHQMDMRFVHIDDLGIHHLNLLDRGQIVGKSWYLFIHPLDIPQARLKHKKLCDTKEGSCTVLIRLKQANGWLWVHTVLAITQSSQKKISALYQTLNEDQAMTLKLNAWLYRTTPTTTATAVDGADNNNNKSSSSSSSSSIQQQPQINRIKTEELELDCGGSNSQPPPYDLPSDIPNFDKPKRRNNKLRSTINGGKFKGKVDSSTFKFDLDGLKSSRHLPPQQQQQRVVRQHSYPFILWSKNPHLSPKQQQQSPPTSTTISTAASALLSPVLPAFSRNLLLSSSSAGAAAVVSSHSSSETTTSGELLLQTTSSTRHQHPTSTDDAASDDLPVIESSSLEAYFSHLESENQNPVAFPVEINSDGMLFGYNSHRLVTNNNCYYNNNNSVVSSNNSRNHNSNNNNSLLTQQSAAAAACKQQTMIAATINRRQSR